MRSQHLSQSLLSVKQVFYCVNKYCTVISFSFCLRMVNYCYHFHFNKIPKCDSRVITKGNEQLHDGENNVASKTRVCFYECKTLLELTRLQFVSR